MPGYRSPAGRTPVSTRPGPDPAATRRGLDTGLASGMSSGAGSLVHCPFLGAAPPIVGGTVQRMVAGHARPPAFPAPLPGLAPAGPLRHGAGVVQRMFNGDDEWDDLETPTRAPIGSAQYNFAASRSVQKGYQTGKVVSTPGKSDLAATHVVPDAVIKRTIHDATKTILTSDDPIAAIDTVIGLVDNTIERNEIIQKESNFKVLPKGTGKRSRTDSSGHAKKSIQQINEAFEEYSAALETTDAEVINEAMQNLHNELSLAPGNLPEYGNHSQVNQPVSDRYHVNVLSTGRLSPISESALRLGGAQTGVAMTKHGNHVVTRQGKPFPVKSLDPVALAAIKTVGFDLTNIPSP